MAKELNTKNAMESRKKMKKQRRIKQFYCPLSPNVLWHHGFIYKECPVVLGERTMGKCQNCELRGQASPKKKNKKQKNIIIEQRKKEEIPVIGKTYHAEEE